MVKGSSLAIYAILSATEETMMKTNDQDTENAINIARRRMVQGMGAAAAVAIAGPVLGTVGNSELGVAELTGRVISKTDAPVKTLILRNNSDKPITISQFSNGGLMFDGEVLDCNGACLDGSVTVSSHKEILVQFDKRYLSEHATESMNFLNVQSRVQRMSAGTRVVEISGTARNGVVTLVPTGIEHS